MRPTAIALPIGSVILVASLIVTARYGPGGGDETLAPSPTTVENPAGVRVDTASPAATPDRAYDPALRALPGRVYDPVWAGEQIPEGFRHALPRDEILPIYDPVFLPAEEVSWSDDMLVIGLEIDGDARAYPVIFLDIREMVIDRVAGIPVVVTWCPLCGTAMVHRRELDGQEILFGIQGALYRNAMTWWDHDTGSVWSQPLGEAILGPRTGATVERLASELTTWGAWREAYPDTWALETPEWVLETPGPYARIGLDDIVVVVEFAGEAVTFAIEDLREVGVANEVVAGTPIAVVSDPRDERRWSVLLRTLDDQTVTLAVVGDSLIDLETASVWDPARGIALKGALRGSILHRLPGFTAFAKDVPRFWPNARVWEPVPVPPNPDWDRGLVPVQV
ncbi:MAG: DUF3179 domain-containing (seleno)protein [Acidimicrobiia bacterium]